MNKCHQHTSNDLVDVIEAAKIIGISDQAIRKAIIDNRLAAVKVGNQWVIEKIDLEEFRLGRIKYREVK